MDKFSTSSNDTVTISNLQCLSQSLTDYCKKSKVIIIKNREHYTNEY